MRKAPFSGFLLGGSAWSSVVKGPFRILVTRGDPYRAGKGSFTLQLIVYTPYEGSS